MQAAAYFFTISMKTEAQDLVRGLRTRNPDLLDSLIEKYQYRLFRYLLYLTGNRGIAEDLFQETWTRVIERGHQYNGKSKFEVWLFAIARHLVIDLQRRRTPQSLDSLNAPNEAKMRPRVQASGAPTPLDWASYREEGERVGAALRCLPATYREVLMLRFQEELALEEIASLVAAPLSTVKSRLYRGLNELRGLLEGTEQ